MGLWGSMSTSLTLGRLPPTQVEQMIERVTGGKRLPAEVRQQVVAKTDGVPVVCGRVDQDGARVRPAPGTGRPL